MLDCWMNFVLFQFISFKGHILATVLLEGDKENSAKEYL